MIARENPETAGVIRDGFMKAKLGREIRDAVLDPLAFPSLSVGVLAREILLESGVDLLQLAPEIIVLRDFNQPRLPRELQHADRIVIRSIPQLWVEMTKETPRRRLPGPPDVKDDLAQRLERGREFGDDVVGQEFRHRGRASGIRARDIVRKMFSS